MATKFLTNLDLTQNQILNGRFEVLASDPESGNFEGRMIYNSTEDTIKVYSGSVWRKMLHSVTSSGTYASYLSVSESNGAITLTLSGTSDATATSIVARDANSQIKVAATPTDNAHAASKGYVDSAISGATVSTEAVQDIVGAQIATNGSHSGITASYDDAGDGAIDLALDSSYSPTFAGLTINGSGIVFEGATADAYETTLAVTDPTADRTLTLPNATDTLVGKATTDTFTNKTFDTAGTGNSFSVNGNAITSYVGSGSNVVLSQSPTITSLVANGLTVEGAGIIFEGATADAYETTLAITDPTADRTITVPDASGTIALLGTIALGTDTTGNYVSGVTAGTGVTVTHTPGEGSSAEIAIGQAVGTTDSPTFNNINLAGSVVFEGDTADAFETTLAVTDPTADRTITLPDVTGTVVTTGNLSAITSLGVLTSDIVFEGATADAYETTLTVTDPTADRTITLPDVTGTVITTGNLSSITSVGTLSSLTISGDLTVNGTTTNINSTNLVVEDKNIVLADVTTPTDTTADGGGITLLGASNKTFVWVDSTDAWTSSEHLDLATGKVYMINGTTVLSGSTLGSGVTSSSLTSVGTITTGVWNGTDIAVADGGTGASSASDARTNLAETSSSGRTTSAPVLARIANQGCAASTAGTSTTTVVHNFGTASVVVEVFEVSSGATVVADVVRTDTNTVTVTMLGTISANDYKIVVTG